MLKLRLLLALNPPGAPHRTVTIMTTTISTLEQSSSGGFPIPPPLSPRKPITEPDTDLESAWDQPPPPVLYTTPPQSPKLPPAYTSRPNSLHGELCLEHSPIPTRPPAAHLSPPGAARAQLLLDIRHSSNPGLLQGEFRSQAKRRRQRRMPLWWQLCVLLVAGMVTGLVFVVVRQNTRK